MTKQTRDRWITAAWAVLWVAAIIVWQLGYTDPWPALVIAFVMAMWKRNSMKDPSPAEILDGPPAGWYTDPQDPAKLRYWNGRKWESLTQPVPQQQSLLQ